MRPTSPASWVGIGPGNNESGGKRFSGRIRKGNRWVKAILLQAAQAAARTKNPSLSAQYHQIAARRGNKRAAVAVGQSILVSSYHMLTTGEPRPGRKERTTFLNWIAHMQSDVQPSSWSV
jgi:transposase